MESFVAEIKAVLNYSSFSEGHTKLSLQIITKLSIVTKRIIYEEWKGETGEKCANLKN